MFRCRFCGRRVDPLSEAGSHFDAENETCRSCARSIRLRGVIEHERELHGSTFAAPPFPLEDDDDPLLPGEADLY